METREYSLPKITKTITFPWGDELTSLPNFGQLEPSEYSWEQIEDCGDVIKVRLSTSLENHKIIEKVAV